MTLWRAALCQSPAGPSARFSPSARPVWAGCGITAQPSPSCASTPAGSSRGPRSRKVSRGTPAARTAGTATTARTRPGQAGQPALLRAGRAGGGAAGAAVCRERARRAVGGRHLLCAADGSAPAAPSSAPSSSFSLLPLRSAVAAGQEGGDRDSEGRGEGGGRGNSPGGAGGPRGASPVGLCGPSARPAGRPGPAPHGISCKHVQL